MLSSYDYTKNNNLLNIESFENTFGSKSIRKKPKLEE